MNDARAATLRRKTINLCPEITVCYGIDIIDYFADELKKYEFDRIFMVSDINVHDIHGRAFFENLNARGIPVCLHILEAAETLKTMDGLKELCDALIDEQISKDSIIVSFGGGVTGNMAGLAAALIYRGIRYIEIPTTFMGMTDSTLSNKQAVNGGSGKNQIGTFYPPLFVWSDLVYASTEHRRYIKAAVTEGIKNTLIKDKELLGYFIDEDITDGDIDVYRLLEMFERITDSKNGILHDDPTEKKYAVILEYGHTFGHAIEYLTDGKIIHGEAVATGMCITAEISCELGILSEEKRDLHYELLEEYMYGNILSQDIYSMITPGLILKQIKNDNKRSGEGVKYVLLEDLGRAYNPDGDYQTAVSDDLVLECIRLYYQTIKNFREGA